jgi:hypothetical protein
MKYILELNFKDKPECNCCMLGRSKGLNSDGETVMACYGLINIPKCVDSGCRKDCPLKPVNE